MAIITNEFIHFKNKSDFLNRYAETLDEGVSYGDFLGTSIIFIQDTNEIWTHGTFYKCDINSNEVETLITSKGYITLKDIPFIPIEATELPKASGEAAIGNSLKYAKEDHVHPEQVNITGNAETANKLTIARSINITGDISGSTTFDGSEDISINSILNNLDASKITSGTISIDRLPKGALERLVIVANKEARFSLTREDIQEGDTVKQIDTDIMYFVVDSSNLNNENGYITYTAGSATSVPWSGVTDKPTIPINTSQLNNDSGFLTSIPIASESVIGGVKIGSNITFESNSISINKDNVISALGYTPANVEDIPKIPLALPNPFPLTINGTSYSGSAALSITLPRFLSKSTLSSSTVYAGYSYNSTSARTITTLTGFSISSPDAVIISTGKLTFTATNIVKMDGLENLSGTYYIYCLSYMANKKIAINGAVYA